jgi:RNA polymerase sigma-70 factor (ECF subfamily)
MGVSFEEAFEAELGPLYGYLRRRLGAAAAEDVAAESFAVAYANWGRFDQTRPLRPWLYGIAANVTRRSWRNERRMLRAYARTGVDPVVVEDDSIVGRIDATSQGRKLAAALAGLGPLDREVLLLHAWAELSDAEIAVALDVPVGTVKSKLHRARQRLRNQIGADEQTSLTTLNRPSEDLR